VSSVAAGDILNPMEDMLLDCDYDLSGLKCLPEGSNLDNDQPSSQPDALESAPTDPQQLERNPLHCQSAAAEKQPDQQPDQHPAQQPDQQPAQQPDQQPAENRCGRALLTLTRGPGSLATGQQLTSKSCRPLEQQQGPEKQQNKPADEPADAAAAAARTPPEQRIAKVPADGAV
jgi:hypothetical protein